MKHRTFYFYILLLISVTLILLLMAMPVDAATYSLEPTATLTPFGIEFGCISGCTPVVVPTELMPTSAPTPTAGISTAVSTEPLYTNFVIFPVLYSNTCPDWWECVVGVAPPVPPKGGD